MRCSEVCELLSSYMDGMLPAEEMKAVDEHLSLCPDCREELRQLEETVAILRNLGEVEPPADLRDSILNKIQASARKGEQVVSIWDRLKRWGSWVVSLPSLLAFYLWPLSLARAFPALEWVPACPPLPKKLPKGSGFLAADMPHAGQGLEMEIFNGAQDGALEAPARCWTWTVPLRLSAR